MKSTRALKLQLVRETLIELSGQDLNQVVGASGVSCNPRLCVTNDTACYSDFQQCITGARCLPTLDHC